MSSKVRHLAKLQCEYIYMYAVFLCLVYVGSLCANYSIVFIHIGDEVPSYTDVAIQQARLFNPKAHIILLASDQGLNRFACMQQEQNIELCSYDRLPKTVLHQQYQERCVERSAFWRFTSERFLYLWDLMAHQNLEAVFHLENDNMLYVDLDRLLPLFRTYYPKIGATFDNEERCIPGFVWIADGEAMEGLAKYFVQHAQERLSDMSVIGKYRQEYVGLKIDGLPIVMPEYSTIHTLRSPMHHTTRRPHVYSQHCEVFGGIFDAAAIGQFLGGIDPIHGNSQPGFINESCLFNPAWLRYQWEIDGQGRKVLYAKSVGLGYPVFNLHVHSKKLSQFKSF